MKLHPEFGTNPTIPCCFWCGKEKNEIVLLGAAYKEKAPRRLFLDYSPCDECQALMDQGCVLIECSEQKIKDRPEIQKGLYPTGRWAVITREAATLIFPDFTNIEKVLVEVGMFDHLGILTDTSGGSK